MQIQRYRLTYPETNSVWIDTKPDKCFTQRQNEELQRQLFTPTIASKCASTFKPWERPTPYECVSKCKGVKIYPISAAEAEALKYPKRNLATNGCLREPSLATYTNSPLGSVGTYQSILENPKRNAPLPWQMFYKGSDAYDPILTTYGNSYTY